MQCADDAAGLSQRQCPVREVECRQADLARRFRAARFPVQPARDHQVHDEEQFLLDGDDDALAHAPHAGDAQPLDGGQRRQTVGPVGAGADREAVLTRTVGQDHRAGDGELGGGRQAGEGFSVNLEERMKTIAAFKSANPGKSRRVVRPKCAKNSLVVA